MRQQLHRYGHSPYNRPISPLAIASGLFAIILAWALPCRPSPSRPTGVRATTATQPAATPDE